MLLVGINEGIGHACLGVYHDGAIDCAPKP